MDKYESEEMGYKIFMNILSSNKSGNANPNLAVAYQSPDGSNRPRKVVLTKGPPKALAKVHKGISLVTSNKDRCSPNVNSLPN